MRLLIFVCLLITVSAVDISQYWVGDWKVVSTPYVCQQSTCCCFVKNVNIYEDSSSGELYINGSVAGNCNELIKEDNINPPTTLNFTEEFFAIDYYNFVLSNTTDLSGLNIDAQDTSPDGGVCSFSLYRATSELLYGNFNSTSISNPPVPFWVSPYIGTWTLDNTCAATSSGCCCLTGNITIDVDISGIESFIVTGIPSAGCHISSQYESDDFPWPTSGTALYSSTFTSGFLSNQDKYNITLQKNSISTYTLTFADILNPKCSMHASRPFVQNTPILFGRSTSRIGTYLVEAGETDASFRYWANWTNTVRGGIRIGNGNNYHPVQLIEYNDASDSTLIPLIYDHLVNINNVSILFSPYSSTLTSIAEKHTGGLPFLFVGSTTDSLYGVIPNGFGLSPPSSKRAITCMQMAAKAGAQTVAAIYTQGDFFNTQASIGALNTCKNYGISVVANDSFVSGNTNFSDYIAKWETLNPDILIISATTPDPFNIVSSIRYSNWWPKQIYFVSASSQDSALLDAIAAGEEWMMEYTIAPDNWNVDQEGTDPFFGSPAGFAAAFMTATNETAVSTYVSAFAAGYVATLAIEAAGSLNTQEIINAMKGLNVNFWYGNLSFLANGAPNINYSCVQILSGIASTVGPQSLAASKYVYPSPFDAPDGFYNVNTTKPPNHNKHSNDTKWIWIGIIIGIVVVIIIGSIIYIVIRKMYSVYFHRKNTKNGVPRPL